MFTPRNPVTLMDRPNGACRYPINTMPSGRGDDLLFCAEAVRGGSIYCEIHHRTCNTGVPKRVAVAARR